MKRLYVSLCSIVLSALPFAADASAIYKCSGDGPVAYQSIPCAGGLRQEMLEVAVGRAEMEPEIPAASGSAARTTPPERESEFVAPPSPLPTRTSPDADRRILFRQTAVALGMTDDEVLNLRGWGRPASIKRSRVGRIWREDWLYERGRLRFENARLTQMDG